MSISFKSLRLLLFITTLVNLTSALDLGKHVIAAINCGGSEVMGAHGIQYAEDTSDEGMASDHGMQFSFNNADAADMEIYQTERWSKDSFEYEFPAGDGEYVVMLKFSEVYFQKAGEKVFNVRINSHTVVKNLDIFDAAGGRGYAHDIYIPVVIKGNSISVRGHSVPFSGHIIIEFAKGPHDNPKINGIAVVRAKMDQMPPLPEKFVSDDSQYEEDFDIYENDNKREEDSFQHKVIRGDDTEENIEMFSVTAPDSENPYEKETPFPWLTVVVALIILIPAAYLLQLAAQQAQ